MSELIYLLFYEESCFTVEQRRPCMKQLVKGSAPQSLRPILGSAGRLRPHPPMHRTGWELAILRLPKFPKLDNLCHIPLVLYVEYVSQHWLINSISTTIPLSDIASPGPPI